MRVSRSDGPRRDFSANKLTISMSYMNFCNFNSKSDRRRYHFFFHLNTALPFPLQNLVQRLRSQTPSSVSSTPSEVSAIPCAPCCCSTAKFYSLIYAGTSRMPPPVLAVWAKTLRGGNKEGQLVTAASFRDN